MAGELAILHQEVINVSGVALLLTSWGQAPGGRLAFIPDDDLTREYRVEENTLRAQVGVGNVRSLARTSNDFAGQFEVRLTIAAHPLPAGSPGNTNYETHLREDLDTLGQIFGDTKWWRDALANSPLSDVEIVSGPEVAFPEQIGNVIVSEYVFVVSVRIDDPQTTAPMP